MKYKYTVSEIYLHDVDGGEVRQLKSYSSRSDALEARDKLNNEVNCEYTFYIVELEENL
tara:strand:+ start:312 stop:488 length:177 start_codon:yes stop_codon:yes gene_type:complete